MIPFRQESGIRAARALLGVLALLALQGCGPYSFRSGSFPDHIRSVAILPFENDTNRFDLTQEFHEQMLRELPRSLGIVNAGEEAADALVRGRITGYVLSTPLFKPGQQDEINVLLRRVALRIEIEIVDLVENVVLFESGSLSTQGEFLEESEDEAVGRALAIELMVQRIIDGAQSNW